MRRTPLAFTKRVIYLQVQTDKLAITVLRHFLAMASALGCPDVVVCDYGMESALICYVMVKARLEWARTAPPEAVAAVPEQPFHPTKSVHNQPVEKFWIEPNARVTGPITVRRRACSTPCRAASRPRCACAASARARGAWLTTHAWGFRRDAAGLPRRG